MSRKNRNGKGISWFYLIFFSVSIIAIAAVMIGLGVVRSRLEEYEAAQPKYVAAQVFARYFDPLDYDKLLADAEYDAAGVASEFLKEYLASEIGEATLTYAAGSSNDPSELKYIVKAGSKQLAAIALNVSDRTTEHGYETYDFSRVELYLNMEAYLDEMSKFSITLEAPEFYTVEVDGEPLTEELITSTFIPAGMMRFYPEDVSAIEYVAYTIEDLRELPESVVVTTPQGEEVLVNYDEESRTYTCSLVYSDEMAEEYSDFVIQAIEGYAAYVQGSNTIGLTKLKDYFDASSSAYSDVVAAGGNRWMANKGWSGIDFEDVSVGEFYVHTPEIFSCHISLVQLLHSEGREDFMDIIDMYLFLHRSGKGYKIYEWFNAA